jgi:hypothetical protein
VLGIGAVGDPRAGGPRPQSSERVLCRFDAVPVKGQSEVVVGARQYHIAALDDGLCRGRHFIHANAEWVPTGSDDLLVLTGKAGDFVEKIHVPTGPPLVRGLLGPDPQ